MSRTSTSSKNRIQQGDFTTTGRIKKIGVSTPYDFGGRGLTPYGGLLPIAMMLEQLKFRELVESTVSVTRRTLSMGLYAFTLAILLGLYIGLERLNHLIYIANDPIVTGILGVARLPVQSTFWRFLQSLRIFNVAQWKVVIRKMRERVWQASHVKLTSVIIDTDTTVETVYGKQMGARKSYNPKHRGKKSFQPIVSFIAETREYIGGRLRAGDRPTGEEIRTHFKEVFRSLPPCVETVVSRIDAGFYCWETVEVHEEEGHGFILVAAKTSALCREWEAAEWKPGPDCDGWTEFQYEPTGWGKAYRFIAVRYVKEPEEEQIQQGQLFETAAYTYRVFVTNLPGRVLDLVCFYDGRAGTENLIKEVKQDAGLGSVPSNFFTANQNFFQLVMLAYNFNCWLGLFERQNEQEFRHRSLGIQRLKFLFIAAKIWMHANRGGIHSSDQYPERGAFERLVKRLKAIRHKPGGFTPVISPAWV